ncbi:MAG TPA: integrase arm-type DNA-binding domain-containing protein [Reyranella sp.]|nr:integrase arm-type DNA-binding domain-containing protein [Reyranella sp.]
MANLTDISIRSLQPPALGQKDYFDASIPGFGVRVSQGGSRSFFLFLGKRSNRRRHAIGRFGIVTLAEARAEAKRLLAEQTLGHDKRRTITFTAALELFAEQKYPALKARTAKDYKDIFRRHFNKKLGDLRLGDIDFDTITAITDKLVRTPSEQRHALVVAGTFLRWCVRRRLLKHNPLEGVDIPKPGKRSRVLTDAELVAVYLGAEKLGYPFGTIVQLLILSGQRRGEIAGLQSTWLSDGFTLPPGFAKNSREHVVPAGPVARGILKNIEREGLLFPAVGEKDRPFSGFSKCKKALDAMLEEVKPYTLHDLRRTFSTNIAKLGVAPHIKEALLNHVSAKTEVEAIYDQYRYVPEMKAALGLWERYLSDLVVKYRPL